MIPGSRLVRRFLYSITILVVLFLGANVVIQQVAQQKLGDALKSHFSLRARPDVAISGFPILLHVLSKELPGLTITARDVSDANTHGLTIDTVTMRLESIKASGSLIGSGPLSLHVSGGSATAVIGQDNLSAFLHDRGQDIAVTFSEGRTAVRASGTFLGGSHTVTGSGVVRLQGSTLRFSPDTSTIRVDGAPPGPAFAEEARRRATFSVAIPALPLGVRLGSVRTRPGTVTLGASLAGRTIQLR